jgi:hypothetical protein
MLELLARAGSSILFKSRHDILGLIVIVFFIFFSLGLFGLFGIFTFLGLLSRFLARGLLSRLLDLFRLWLVQLQSKHEKLSAPELKRQCTTRFKNTSCLGDLLRSNTWNGTEAASHLESTFPNKP